MLAYADNGTEPPELIVFDLPVGKPFLSRALHGWDALGDFVWSPDADRIALSLYLVDFPTGEGPPVIQTEISELSLPSQQWRVLLPTVPYEVWPEEWISDIALRIHRPSPEVYGDVIAILDTNSGQVYGEATETPYP
jgi:hypothetical protein